MYRDAIGRRLDRWLLALATLSAVGSLAARAGEIRFEDVTAASGIHYERVPSKTNALYERLKHEPLYTMQAIVATPEKPRGAPGVALVDVDGDGDVDLYVTNGPGAANGLFQNQLAQTGRLAFVDRGEAAGVAARDQDSTGVCFGDLDNDGDPDLLVLGRSEPNRLFQNRGDGTFVDATRDSGLGGDTLGHTSCAMGDVDGDGLLDIVVANSYDWKLRAAILTQPWSLNQPNQLFLNLGDGRFRDVSATSGIRDLTGFVPPRDGAATLTWGIALVDYDQDGDLDLIEADDQGALPPTQVSRGLLHVLDNDGHGHFTDVTPKIGTAAKPGSWMGLSFADFNCDGRMDFFATNMGDYAFSAIGFPLERGMLSSRWFLGRADGGFEDPGVGALRATSFGWSVVTPDLDNDGDPDVVDYGSLDATIQTITADNPGTVLENQGCSATFLPRVGALAEDHARRNVQGAATGDLDGDGFPDLVSVSAFDIPPEVPLATYPAAWNSPFDRTARYVEVFSPVGNGAFSWNGYEFPNGHLVVERNRGVPGNGWVAVRTLGTAGLIYGGRVNRDGIGAVVAFTPDGGRRTLRPVEGGSSYASENSLTLLFGLGHSPSGTLDVLWPGGVRNRLDGVARGERVRLPEIPCSFDGGLAPRVYRGCVADALEGLVEKGILSRAEARRFERSALTAYRDAHAARRAREVEARR